MDNKNKTDTALETEELAAEQETAESENIIVKTDDAPSQNILYTLKTFWIDKIWHKITANPIISNILLWITLALTLTFVLEIFNRLSFFGALKFALLQPHKFLLNTALVMLFTSFMLITKRKFFTFAVTGSPFLIIGTVNAVLLNIKHMPFAASDLILAGEAFELFDKYLNPLQIALIIVGFACLVAGLVLLFKKSKQFDFNKKRDLKIFIPIFIVLLVLAVLVTVFDFFPRKTSETPSELYERNGFLYAFYKSAGPSGVSKPVGHSSNEIDNLVDKLTSSESNILKEKPNIIVMQLESFFDMTWMVNENNPNTITLSEDPIPNFRKLCDEGASGYLYVPSYGGGTSNVEFEVLTGMNLEHFQIGESPYYTLLNKNVLTDAAPFNFKNLGYTAHAIHNYSALFYERQLAYNNLGFDTFTSVEYMNDIEYNYLSWPKDKVLPREIMSALKSTEGEDFVFTVSVQGHGPYPETYPAGEFESNIKVDGTDFGANTQGGLEYYANTIYEMDAMLGELIKQLEEFDEDCILVVYGDHLPAIDFRINWISAPSTYTSKYAIWTNYELDAEDRNLNTYQLMSHVQALLGTSEGILSRYHMEYSDADDYQERLHSLEYSLTNTINTRDDSISLSCHPVKIHTVEIQGNTLSVEGENFTPFSKISYKGETVETEFDSDTRITADISMQNIDVDDVTVVQISKDGLTILETITK